MEYLPLLYVVLPIAIAGLLFYMNYIKTNNIYLNFLVSQVVQVVEQLKRDGKIENKKKEAVKLIQSILLKNGFSLSETVIEEFIEKWVWTLYNQLKPTENIKEIDLT